MTPKELLALLDAQPAHEFIDGQLLGRRPWILDADEAYDAWRTGVSHTLGTDSGAILIVGSAATGYSLSPLKPGRPFRPASILGHAQSDIDIALIDPNLFIAVWDEIVMRDRRFQLGGTDDTRDRMRFEIYHGLVGQQNIPRNTEPARILLSAMSEAGRSPPLRGYRIRTKAVRA